MRQPWMLDLHYRHLSQSGFLLPLSEEDILLRARQIINEGGEIIDIGAYSSRPDAQHISTEEEASRLKKALTLLNKEMPEAVISVDTFRADIAKMCVEEHGVAIINDISAGSMDDRMMPVVAKLGVPYIMMHMKGTLRCTEFSCQFVL